MAIPFTVEVTFHECHANGERIYARGTVANGMLMRTFDGWIELLSALEAAAALSVHTTSEPR